MKLTLSQKILAGFIACAVVLVAVAIFSFRNSEKFIDTNQWVNHTHEVLYEFEQVLAATVDAETGSRGFVITGNESFLEPYKNARDRISEHLDKVKDLTADNLAQQKNIEALQKQTERLIKHLEELN